MLQMIMLALLQGREYSKIEATLVQTQTNQWLYIDLRIHILRIFTLYKGIDSGDDLWSHRVFNQWLAPHHQQCGEAFYTWSNWITIHGESAIIISSVLTLARVEQNPHFPCLVQCFPRFKSPFSWIISQPSLMTPESKSPTYSCHCQSLDPQTSISADQYRSSKT